MWPSSLHVHFLNLYIVLCVYFFPPTTSLICLVVFLIRGALAPILAATDLINLEASSFVIYLFFQISGRNILIIVIFTSFESKICRDLRKFLFIYFSFMNQYTRIRRN